MQGEIKTELAAEAVGIVNGARRAAYGTPERNFGRIARLWEAYLQLKSEHRLLSSEQFSESEASAIVAAIRVGPADIAAMMRLMKECRLIESPDHRDSYVDLVGYTLCGAELTLPAPNTIEGTAQEVVEAPPMTDPPQAEEPARYNRLALADFTKGKRVKLPNAPGLGTVTGINAHFGTVTVQWDNVADGYVFHFVPEDLVLLTGATPERPKFTETHEGFKLGDLVNLHEFADDDNPGVIEDFTESFGKPAARVRWGGGNTSKARLKNLKHVPTEARAS